MDKPVTTKTEEQLRTADPRTLTSTEVILRQLILYDGMTLERAIAALEELP